MHLFVRTRAELAREAPRAINAVRPDGVLWISYPKKSAAGSSDLSRNVLWKDLAPLGWGPVSQVSLDDTWSAMRFRPEASIKRTGGAFA